jgi:CBS-domain-containing membrane protein
VWVFTAGESAFFPEQPQIMTQADLRARGIMSREVQTVKRNDQLAIADNAMKQERIRHLPVLDGGKLVGILTEADFVKRFAGT